MSHPVTVSTNNTEPTLGALVASASRDLSSLVRGEIELAKAELTGEVKAAVSGGVLFAAAGFLALLATVIVSVAIGFALVSAGLVAWLAFLIVAVVYLLVAGALVFLGIRRVKKISPPKRSITAAKDTVAALKGHAPGTAS